VFAALAVVVGIAASSGAPVSTTEVDPYAVKWWSVDTGGGKSQSGTYALYGTAGQAESGVQTGGTYSLSGGFWSQAAGAPIGIDDQPAPAPPLQLALHSANPLQRASRITFDLPYADRARIRVYDVRGAVVSTLLDTGLGAGSHEIQWTGLDESRRPLAAGVYFLRLEQQAQEVTRKFVFMR
jgi:hypothetical protein